MGEELRLGRRTSEATGACLVRQRSTSREHSPMRQYGVLSRLPRYIYDSMLRDGLNDAFSDQHSGWHTEDLVREFQVSREAQDRWALRSQQRFAAAQATGNFEHEIIGIELSRRKCPTLFETDEHNRPE